MINTISVFSSFSVDDVAKAKRFYNEVLGLETKDNEMGLLELQVSAGYIILIYPKPNHVSATFTVLNFEVDDIEKTVDALVEKGVTFEQYDGEIKTNAKGICTSDNGPDIAWFKDPAGNILSVLSHH